MTGNPRGKGADRSFISNFFLTFCPSAVAFPLCSFILSQALVCAYALSRTLFRALSGVLAPFNKFACSLALTPPHASVLFIGPPSCVLACILCCLGDLERWSHSLSASQQNVFSTGRVELAFWCVGFYHYASDPAEGNSVMCEILRCVCLRLEVWCLVIHNPGI